MLIVLLVSWFSISTPLTVIVDAGHGGKDSGAVHGKVRESELTLSVGKILARRLRKDRRFQIVMTRKSDHFISLQDRADKTFKDNPHVFISLHVNSAPDKRAHGAEFYFQNQLPPDEETMFIADFENRLEEEPTEVNSPVLHSHPEIAGILQDIKRSYNIAHSWQLASSMQKTWKSNRSRRKSIRQAPFFLLSQADVPSVLVEMGFLTSKKDLKVLTNKSSHYKIAADLHRALIDYKELIDKASTNTVESWHAQRSTKK